MLRCRMFVAYTHAACFGGFAAPPPAAPPGGAAAGLGDSCQRGADNPHDLLLWRIRNNYTHAACTNNPHDLMFWRIRHHKTDNLHDFIF